VTMGLTYSSYLELHELLSLQKTASQGKAHDEMLFIIVHQTYELWFKELLHELDLLSSSLARAEIAPAQFTLKRVLSIIELLNSQMDVLETMTAPQFLAFRDLLGTASGFQSPQFRELEFVMGRKRREVLAPFPADSEFRARLEARYRAPTLWDSFVKCLAHSHSIPPRLLDRDVTQPPAASSEIQETLLAVYAKEPALAYLCELLLDLDEGLQEWRYRHVKMVERIIGAKRGTGGSTGVEYLKSTLFQPSFPDLWEIRTQFRKA
jgi:tryptophan 2,3-dioxygenase